MDVVCVKGRRFTDLVAAEECSHHHNGCAQCMEREETEGRTQEEHRRRQKEEAERRAKKEQRIQNREQTERRVTEGEKIRAREEKGNALVTSEQPSGVRDAEVTTQGGKVYWDFPHDDVLPSKKYCFIHSHYYQLECELCREEKAFKEEPNRHELQYEEHLKHKVPVEERLEKCPLCKQGMLRWNASISKYECLNWNCRRTITKEYFQSHRSLKDRIRLRLPTFNTISKISAGLFIVAIFTLIFLYGLTDFGHSRQSVIPVSNPTPTPPTHVIVVSVVTPTPLLTPASKPIATPTPYVAGCVGSVCTYYGEQPPYARTGFGYDTIQLVDNHNATDPSWLQLKAFITADKTDEKLYIEDIYMCGAFAEDVHNNAEAAGIKAAWVSIDFQDGSAGHALNAFKTTDMGLVYIDCTSSRDSFTLRVCRIDHSTGRCIFMSEEPLSYDRVAYISIDKAYGSISLNAVRGFSYFDYETYRQRENAYDAALAQYNSDVAAYNADSNAYDSLFNRCGGYATAGECQRLIEWYDDLERQGVQLDRQLAQLEAQEAALGELWLPLGIVSKIEIYW